MKAFAVLAACLLLSAPAQAFFHGGGAQHPGHGGFHHGHGGYGFGGYGGDFVPGTPEPTEPAPDVEPVAVQVPVPVPYCPRPAPARAAGGPHIIYIGRQPAVHGPQVIYGRE